MHAVKGGWVGQTFALAKNNESEGRKSRIRRSKEERKTMVESFIKKYQKLNNGSFPSLNLTHKEVGGSFYTVREIVRDIIQENRVLGPAKFAAEGQTIDQFLEHNPLGSIAAQPQNALSVSSNESQFVFNQNQGSIRELVFASDGHLVTLEHQNFDSGRLTTGTQIENDEAFELKSTELDVNGPMETEKNAAEESVVSNEHCIGPEYQMFSNGIVNGSQVDLKDEKAEELTCKELQTVESLEAQNNVEEVSETPMSKVTPIAAAVIVETFPIKPVTGTTEGLDGKLQEVNDLNISTEDKGTGGMELPVSVDDRVELNLSTPLIENKLSSVDEEALKNARHTSLEGSNYSTFDGIVCGKGSTNVNAQAFLEDVPTSENLEQSHLTAGAKATEVPDSLPTKDINGSTELLKTKEVFVNEDEVDAEFGSSLQKGSSPTLDRINLESWEAASKKSTKPEGNPLWGVFKAFLDAFVKFWSE